MFCSTSVVIESAGRQDCVLFDQCGHWICREAGLCFVQPMRSLSLPGGRIVFCSTSVLPAGRIVFRSTSVVIVSAGGRIVFH